MAVHLRRESPGRRPGRSPDSTRPPPFAGMTLVCAQKPKTTAQQWKRRKQNCCCVCGCVCVCSWYGCASLPLSLSLSLSLSPFRCHANSTNDAQRSSCGRAERSVSAVMSGYHTRVARTNVTRWAAPASAHWVKRLSKNFMHASKYVVSLAYSWNISGEGKGRGQPCRAANTCHTCAKRSSTHCSANEQPDVQTHTHTRTQVSQPCT